MFSKGRRHFKQKLFPYLIWDLTIISLKKQRLIYGLAMQMIFISLAYIIFLITTRFVLYLLFALAGSVLLIYVFYEVLMQFNVIEAEMDLLKI